MSEEIINEAILTLDVLIDCTKEDGTYYNAQKEWEALEVFKKLQQENKQLKQYDKNKDTRNSRQRVANYELLKENKRLKEENIKLQMKYISVLDEIREQLKFERKIALSLNKPYTVSVIDKLLDKVKE